MTREEMVAAVEGLLESGVEKPSRYAGGEWNAIQKPEGSFAQRFCMCFPDNYEVGMSHLGSRILYGLANECPETFAERCFAPWPDMEEKMREAGLPLFGVDTRTPLMDFDILGFTLQYEMSYTNILNMIDLAGMPIRAAERGNGMPFVVCGGPCAVNPEPLAPFVDAFLIGDGEESLPEMLALHLAWKKAGGDRESFLRQLANMDGCYVPKYYTPVYDEASGDFARMEAAEGVQPTVKRRIVEDFENTYFPTEIVVPYVASVHDRVMLEVFRGCTRGCRFCQAGFLYRPVRQRSVETLKRQALASLDATGYEELSLTSLSTGDYQHLTELIDQLLPECQARHVSMQLPSLRVDSFAGKTAEQLSGGRKGSLTFAPEAGTQRLRDVINKGVNEEDLLRSVRDAFQNGWNSVKLYFMIGLPTETDEDLDGIVDLAGKVAREYFAVPKEQRNKGLRISVSASTFVPKPCTPFQWEPQDSLEEILRKQRYLKEKFRSMRSAQFHYHGPQLSHLEAVFAKGDRRIAEVLERAWRKGCRFDAWTEYFNNDLWLEAFAEQGIDTTHYANRRREIGTLWPFGHIDTRVREDYLAREWARAVQGEITSDCRGHCNGCFEGADHRHYCEEMRSMPPIKPGSLCG